MRWAWAALIGLAGLISLLPGDAPPREGWRLLAPDDAGGLVFRSIVSRRGEGAVLRADTLTPTADCCSSSAQWALSAERVDAAVLCPHAARHLLEKDGRYEIAGPCLLNADVWVIRPENESRKVAVMQNREYQAEALISAGVPPAEIAPMLPVGIPYALEKGFVGSGVMDILTAMNLGAGLCRPLSSGDIETYVLVVRRDFRESPEWAEFVHLYNEGVAAIADDPSKILRTLRLEFNQEGMKLWKGLRVTFMALDEAAGA